MAVHGDIWLDTKTQEAYAFPTTPVHGDIWLDTKTQEAYVYQQYSWNLVAYDVNELTHTTSWVWKRNTVNINDNMWWDINKFEIFDWLLAQSIKWRWKSPHELHLIKLSPELKTMFTLRWK